MPVPIAALVGAGAGLLGGGINAISQGSMNRKTRQWSEKMYQQQYADNLAFWRMQNEYNDPTNQMARLKAAGLNPALLYGSSSSGASGQAGPVNTPDVQPVQYRTPQWGDAFTGGVTGFLDAIYAMDIKQATLDNLRADNTVKLEEAALKAAQTAQAAAGTARSKFDLEFETEMRSISADARRENLRKIKADTRYQLDENERRAALTSQSLKEGTERILNMRLDRARTRAEIDRIKAIEANLKRTGILDDMEIEMRKLGLSWNDDLRARIIARVLGPENLLSAKDKLIKGLLESSQGNKRGYYGSKE